MRREVGMLEALASALKSASHTADVIYSGQREWAKGLVRALCQNFREKSDQDGRTGMEAHFYPTLKSLTIDHVAGTIRAFIVEPYTD